VKLSLELAEGMRIAWSAIRANAMRSMLTTLGIVIGVATVSLMGSAIAGLNTAFKEGLSILGSDVYFIQKFEWGDQQAWEHMRNRRDITLRDARRLREAVTFARGVSIEAQSSQAVRFEDRSADAAYVVGKNEDGALVGGLLLREGRYLSRAEVDGGRPVCVLGAEIADNLFPVASPLGKKVRIGGRKFEVIGTLEPMGEFLFANLDNQVIIPITRLISDFTWRPDVMINVKVRDPERMEEARDQLRGIMRRIRKLAPGDPDDFGVNQQDQIVSIFNRVGGTIAAVGLVITGLSLFVGGIGIMNVMFVSVMERTTEIGLRKALGARRRTILLQFLLEASSISLLGGLIGLAIAYPGTLLMTRFLPTTLSLPVVGLALGVSIVTGLVSGLLPAYRASRLNPVDALREE